MEGEEQEEIIHINELQHIHTNKLNLFPVYISIFIFTFMHCVIWLGGVELKNFVACGI